MLSDDLVATGWVAVMAAKCWPQPGNEAQNFDEQGSGDGDLRHLESDVTAAADDLGAEPHQLLVKRVQ